MEPLLQALSIVEGVTEEICSALGNDALKHINADLLFATAELHVNNGLSVNEAKAEIIASVLPKVEKSLKKERPRKMASIPSDHDMDNDNSEGNTVLHGKIKGSKTLEESARHSGKTSDVDKLKEMTKSDPVMNHAGSSKVIKNSQKRNFVHDHGNAEAGSSKGSKSLKFCKSNKSNVRHKELELSLERSTPVSNEESTNYERDHPALNYEESEKRTLTTAVCKYENNTDCPSCTGNSSPSTFEGGCMCNKALVNVEATGTVGCGFIPDSSSVGSPEISVLSPSPKPTPLIDLGDDSTCSDPPSCGSDIVVVEELEKSASENQEYDDRQALTSDFEGVLNIPGASGVVPSKSPKVNSVKYAVDQAFDLAYTSDTDVGNSRETHIADLRKTPPSPASQVENMQQSIGNSVDIGKEDISKNHLATKRNGDSDYVGNSSGSVEDPSEKLWKDAQFICSLLPYFELADVQETMVANFYHPDRKARVLEEYIQLALDRDEMVPDSVFLSLNAARKRSHTEACGQDAVNGKKQKVGYDDPGTASLGKTYNDVNVAVEGNESLPSTSSGHPKAGLPATVNNQEKQAERENWIQEKLDFVSAVVCGMDKDQIVAQLKDCYSDNEVETLITRLLEEPSRPQVASQLDNASVATPDVHNQPNTSAFQAVDRGRPAELPMHDDNNASGEGPSGEGEAPSAADTEDRIMAQISTLTEMFSDADPDYLRERCVGINGKPEEFQSLVEELMEKKNYPKLEEYLKRQKRLEIKKKFIEGMSVEEFLEYFEDPEKVFCDTEKKMSVTYMENARTQLLRDLPYHLSKEIDNELRKNNYHYLPTLRALEGNRKLSRRKTKRGAPPKESDLDDIFIKELCYVRMQLEIKEYILKKEENKRRAFLWAKAANQLQECGCCCDDEILEEDMDSCNSSQAKHKFCCNCIRRFAEEEIGQGRINFRCLEGDCKAEFSLSTLKKLMKPSVFSNILARKQLEEIAAAGIEDLESCPFCNFQTIMPNKEDKVFKCLNPECMKDSCRLCKEPNHVPLRCEEVEKQHQKDARTFLENKMTEAMVRECWRCKKRFIKADGCNKMRCSCGAMMCYICKKPIKGYDHFEDNPVPINKNKCPLWSNSEKIHAEEVRDAAKKLKDELDPGIELKHDPTKDLPEVPKHLEQWQNRNVQVYVPPPAHQRREHHIIPVYGGPVYPPLAHHHQRVPPQAHHHHPQIVPQAPIDPHQPPQPAHQHPAIQPIHLFINPGRNDFHHHHHHHYHHHVRHQPNGREVGNDRHHLLEQINEFNEVLRIVRHDHQQENMPPVVYPPNPLRFQQRVVQLHPPQNVQNLPQEPHDPFIREI